MRERASIRSLCGVVIRRAPSSAPSLTLADHGLRSLEELIAHYRSEHADRAVKELRWFSLQKTLKEAIRLAGQAKMPSGKRFKHQHRVSPQALNAFAERLLQLESQIAATQTFEQLHALLCSDMALVAGIGELTRYDTALRIGAWLKLEPNEVFLHAGTRVGAKALGFDPKASIVALTDLPHQLRALRAQEVEDILCIYKDDLIRLMRAA